MSLQSENDEDFGFKHLLWIYCGRCGDHCWICVRKSNNDERKAIVVYLEVIKTILEDQDVINEQKYD
ncbi:6188_t:CDS:2 [Diversispora eburnea]|uniref:6188_t:CDS:1 n=1 Tax=Diversispora eburnea TaxID=1213867 RepID=A0A9N9F1I6_9GLOM|nr:6188_t:CDS:2 [Diversispora eburnea]